MKLNYIFEYCYIVRHDSLPVYLADIIERVQKRALKIILPGMSYCEALTELHCPSLHERHGALCGKSIKKVAGGSRLFHLLIIFGIYTRCQ